MYSDILPLFVVPESFHLLELELCAFNNPPLSGTAVHLLCSGSSVQDLQTGTSPWSYLLSSCDGVGMTLNNPIPQLYVPH